ncbi:biopolymer transporter ExbD [Endozoicomonas gorgoniicola]|uniref:Biopolymer transporter ExbD n=1 Tax=Endozoicomonas gorgoniicola TaxID=1234144 RepID=A0ABT3MSU7_9GAMM|nr:biopolymer transporter ExbD [Endozoicomonas gorgoniicola]MCW7552456.1 biopolymer transporter ExbD [Endozoicomonas gorgoniicola]
MRFKHQDTATEEASVDMTPLIDVVFILLIFFILSASFQTQQSIQIERPQAATSDSQSVSSLIVTLNHNGEIFIDGQNLDLAVLALRAEQKAAGSSVSSALIRADKKIDSGRLIAVIDKLRLAGIDNVAVATEKMG